MGDRDYSREIGALEASVTSLTNQTTKLFEKNDEQIDLLNKIYTAQEVHNTKVDLAHRGMREDLVELENQVDANTVDLSTYKKDRNVVIAIFATFTTLINVPWTAVKQWLSGGG